ncbi:type IV pilus assembly protein PilM [Blastopirellula sp. JC732]|uniref:Type IV pilus assembly protein PilM n=1 Tax=Blastopirellula sediminis TaxID=2894196 RepID=A0A9X1MSP5_9BACT|nr:type IV pilus assembly protein PilM [Blastopirellula sediminis]MCC9604550.1 type IV pilus assembly protein PilM [Blastopirellula sediminis]MCC9632151.1 type IV pilus assembly protein PilM [Blastopirellula sediminis]
MIRLPFNSTGPIGVDVGSRSIKMVQFSADRKTLHEYATYDLPSGSDSVPSGEKLQAALHHCLEGRRFRGKDAVVCLGRRDLFLQNIRIPKSETKPLELLVQQEAAGRIPYSVTDAEIRHFATCDVRQGDVAAQEVVVMACHRPTLEQRLETIEAVGLRPLAVDVEPAAILRSYCNQYRRESDATDRVLYVHIGNTTTVVVIAEGDKILFIKYLDLGGRQFDEAVEKRLDMSAQQAADLRKHNGDRRRTQQDPEIARSLAEAMRPIVEKLLTELSMCVRYHSVTFRGKPLVRLVLSGGEANEQLAETLGKRLSLDTELGDPLRVYDETQQITRRSIWDVAVGLALRAT